MDVEETIAFTRLRAAQLAGLTERQVDYWMRTSLLEPAMEERLGSRPIRLYDYRDALSLLVISALRERGLSVQHIRRLVTFFRTEGFDSPLTELRYAVFKKKVYIQHANGDWVGEDKPAQTVIPDLLPLEPLRATIVRAAGQRHGAAGQTERRRGAMGSKELFAGTRVPVETVRRSLPHGASVQDVRRAFPALQLADVETAARRAS